MPRQLVEALEKVGFEIDHQTGSHVVLWRAGDGARVIVPWHNRDLGRDRSCGSSRVLD
jgi:predicted RNA binding protein YcfA (HicA-like mRNA interferase family)